MKKPLNTRDKYFVKYKRDKMTLCKACRLAGLHYGSVYHSMVGSVTPQEAFEHHLERQKEAKAQINKNKRR